MSNVHLFGIRHHGPGCARSLLRALEELRPDCVLIEGPPDAEELIGLAAAEGMEPPVALLAYSPEDPKRGAFFPFAEFSPEWQAILFAVKEGITVRFIDLPQTNQLAIARDEEAAAAAALPAGLDVLVQEQKPVESDGLRRDPLGWLGHAAGYGGGEQWWEHMVEQRQDGNELFAAIAEAMTAVRTEIGPPLDPSAARIEALREAHMRKAIRVAQKEGRERIVVICGAWHVSALAEMPSAASDNDLLKGLPKMKVEVTWVPWTYHRLAAESGYRAGVDSPAWYEHLWRRGGKVDSISWFSRAARLLREADIDCSSAHVIECVRLVEALASVRDRPMPGLTEMMEAAETVLTTGEVAPLRLIRRDLIIGRKLGKISDKVPTVPIQRDLEKQQKSLRLKVSATEERVELDLRKENDLARSRLLHRLRLLNVNWGTITESRAGKGTFREVWKLQWQPEYSLAVIEAAPYGNTVEQAATAFAIRTAAESQDLLDLTRLVSSLLVADLPDALSAAMRELQNRAAVTGDVPQLMAAVPPLAKVSRYGDVRQTDARQVVHVLEGFVVRICIGLGAACQSLDEEAAMSIGKQISDLHGALKLIENPEQLSTWLNTVAQIADAHGIHEYLHGLSARLLLDEKHPSAAQTADRMSRALSRGVAPESAAAWLEGFLSGSGMVLVHDETLLPLVDGWVSGLTPDHFTQVLPLVRRTFATFPPMERRHIGERIRQGTKKGEGSAVASQHGFDALNPERVAKLIPVLRIILGCDQK